MHLIWTRDEVKLVREEKSSGVLLCLGRDRSVFFAYLSGLPFPERGKLFPTAGWLFPYIPDSSHKKNGERRSGGQKVKENELGVASGKNKQKRPTIFLHKLCLSVCMYIHSCCPPPPAFQETQEKIPHIHTSCSFFSPFPMP